MRRMSLFAGAAMLLLATPQLGLAQGQGQGKGQSGGQGAENRGGGKERAARQGQKDRKGGPDRGREARRESKGPPQNKGAGRPAERRERADVRPARQEARGPDLGRDVRRQAEVVRIDGRDTRAVRIVDARDRDRVRIRVLDAGRYRWNPVRVTGCPPGLAKKGSGCMPPGQARNLAAANDPLRYWSRYAPWWDDVRHDDWRYWDGYAYRYDPVSGSALSFMPLLGGALWPGQVWPAGYTAYPVDPYYVDYYGFSDPYDYRYANGALFAVDPETQAISAIAALLTGDNWAVGAPMPVGYSAYNVPPPYRARYYDSPNAWYRYSDGYVYRIDPETMLIAEAISLLT